MILSKKDKDYVYDMIRDTYNAGGVNSLVIAIEQAIKENNFYNFNNNHNSVDKLLRELDKDSPNSIKKYGLNVSFLYRICELYVKKAKKDSRSHSTLEDHIRNSDMSEDGLAGSIFILMYNEIAKEGHKLSELTVYEDFKKIRDHIGSAMLFHAFAVDMSDVFANEIKKEELLKKIKEKSFFKNTAQNIRMLIQSRDSQLLSGIKDKDGNYRQQIKKGKYKRDNKEEVHRDVGKTLHAVSTIGMVRDNQEDAALIMVHPNNPKLKIALVCDGAGGHDRGEVASYYLAKSIQDWFFAEGEKLYKINSDEAQDEKIINDFKTIDSRGKKDINGMYDREERAMTTMVCAIVMDGKAKILHSGDSRAYIVKNGKLFQITKDQSYAVEQFEEFGKNATPYIQPDDTRFYTTSNYVLNSFFINRNGLKKDSIQTLNKGTYDKILLCSDGLSDCMSNEEIAYFSKNVKGKRLASFLVQAANINKSEIPRYLKKFYDMDKEQYEFSVRSSKDNATAVVFEADKDDDLER